LLKKVPLSRAFLARALNQRLREEDRLKAFMLARLGQPTVATVVTLGPATIRAHAMVGVLAQNLYYGGYTSPRRPIPNDRLVLRLGLTRTSLHIYRDQLSQLDFAQDPDSAAIRQGNVLFLTTFLPSVAGGLTEEES
jgi:hypothetical protein